MAYPRAPLMRNMLRDNLALIAIRNSRRGNTNCFFIADTLVDKDAISPFDNCRFFPLYLYHDDGSKTANLNLTSVRKLTRNINVQFSPEDLLDYMYAIFHSAHYRNKYKEFLKIDYARVPVPKSDSEFTRLAQQGSELRELHLMKVKNIESFSTTFPVSGSDFVDGIDWVEGDHPDIGSVYINNEQYFGEVPRKAWETTLGGYRPAQKWLKDRKNHKLTNDDIEHYQHILKILGETNRIMEKIDDSLQEEVS